MSDDQQLKDRVAIVTGAGGDIGMAIARRFHAAGARVILVDLKAVDAAEETMVSIACDVSDPSAVERTVGEIVDRFGGIDIVVNNAAAETPLGTVCDIPLDSWRRTLDVNLTGAFLLCKYAVPHLRAASGRRGGVILNIASQLGHVTTPGRAAYSASKAALLSLTRSLALDHAADGIRAVSLSPGAVLTGRVSRQAGGAEQAVAALAPLHPIGRIGMPEEIAATAVFLVSDGAAFITGSDVLVDGGYTAR